MSSRPQFNPYPVIQDGDMSDDITSEVTIIQKLSMISYGLSWNGSTPVGTAQIQVSNDYSENSDGSVRNAGTWNDLPDMSAAISGNSGNGAFDIVATGFYAIRLVYTATSGTGLLQAIVAAKVS